MSEHDQLVAAVSIAVIDAAGEERSLLQAIVEVARAIFGARASSVFLLDEPTGELVFEAVAGEGAGLLVGRRFSAVKGVAGWVMSGRQPLVVADLAGNPSFARDVAESTGYVPEAMLAAPLLHDDEALGVLEVLDPAPAWRASLGEMRLLELFAVQAAVALRLLQRSRAAQSSL